MKEKTRRYLSLALEFVVIVLLFTGCFIVGHFLFFIPVDFLFSKGISFKSACPAVVIFDGFWILMITKVSRNIHVKIVSTLIVIALSAALLTCFVVVPPVRSAFM